MADKFEAGQIVQLISGGPAMTVAQRLRTMDGEVYRCEWFKGASKEQSNFIASSLKMYEPPKKSDD